VSISEHEAGNRAFWEQAAATHGTQAGDRYYDLAKVVAGGTLLTVHEESAIAAATGAPPEEPLSRLAGLDVLHLQSHIGVDGVVMARAGARVTCADWSPTALRRAHELAEQVGVTIETVECDARSLPESLHGRFDLVYVTIGAICWIDDLDLWMRQVAAALRPGGGLVLVELHPLLQMFEARVPEIVMDLPYGGGVGATWEGSGTYADPDAQVESSTTCYAHSIGEIVTSAIDAGMRVDRLVEHDALDFDPRGDELVTRDDDGRLRLRLGRGREEGTRGEPLPVAFTLLATKA
jgi:SAM-dependent methyltransferase